MKNNILMLFILGCSSCSNVVEIDSSLDKQKIAVNSLFSSDSSWQVSVTRSRDVLNSLNGTYFLPVEDAVVTLYDENDNLIETLKPSYDKFFKFRYSSVAVPQSERPYKISIQVDGEPPLTAFSNVPAATPINSVEVDSSGVVNGEVRMKILFQDPAGIRNFYSIKILRDFYTLVDEDTVRYVEDVYFDPVDPVFDNLSINQNTLIRDDLFDGRVYDFRLKTSSTPTSGVTERIRVVLLSISEDYYEYFTTKNLQDEKKDDPFAQPTQVYSNIENGLGIFAGFSSSVVNL